MKKSKKNQVVAEQKIETKLTIIWGIKIENNVLITVISMVVVISFLIIILALLPK